jgi:hypothetical protein
MADKAPHRDKRTIYGRQRTTQGQKDNLWPTKHHTGTKGQSMADKTAHMDKRTIHGRKVLLSLCGALSAIDCPFVPVWFFVGHRLSFCLCVVLCRPEIVHLSAIDCPFVPVWCFVGHRSSFCDKAPHRDKRTIYGRQNSTHGQMDNLLPTKHHTGTKGQSVADKAPHRDIRIIYGRQSTTQGQKDNLWPTKHHIGTKEQSMADYIVPFVPVCCFVGHKLSFCPCVVLCRP